MNRESRKCESECAGVFMDRYEVDIHTHIHTHIDNSGKKNYYPNQQMHGT